jgi:hypothetical protein
VACSRRARSCVGPLGVLNHCHTFPKCFRHIRSIAMAQFIHKEVSTAKRASKTFIAMHRCDRVAEPVVGRTDSGDLLPDASDGAPPATLTTSRSGTKVGHPPRFSLAAFRAPSHTRLRSKPHKVVFSCQANNFDVQTCHCCGKRTEQPRSHHRGIVTADLHDDIGAPNAV